jgi:uncharacterized membrane protein YgaE (UPF0421/DUF939 family)
MLICQLLGIHPATFAAITVVINMQPSVNKALKNAWEQVRLHLASVLLAILLGLFLGNSPWVIGLGVILIIAIAHRLKWQGISLGVVSIVFVLDAPPDQFLMHAGFRSVSIFIGLAVALAINRGLAPPRYKETLTENTYSLFLDSSVFFLQSIEHFVESTPYSQYEKAKPLNLESRLNQVMELYEYAREEFTSSDKAIIIERLVELSRGFIERGENIEEMTRQRVKRRQAPDSPLQSEDEISKEFEEILQILLEGKAKLEILRDKTHAGLSEQHAEIPTSQDLQYWSRFDKAMDEWQRTVSGVFYLRAMMEVAVVATEMRWAARRMKSIYNLSSVDTKARKSTSSLSRS